MGQNGLFCAAGGVGVCRLRLTMGAEMAGKRCRKRASGRVFLGLWRGIGCGWIPEEQNGGGWSSCFGSWASAAAGFRGTSAGIFGPGVERRRGICCRWWDRLRVVQAWPGIGCGASDLGRGLHSVGAVGGWGCLPWGRWRWTCGRGCWRWARGWGDGQGHEKTRLAAGCGGWDYSALSLQ